MSLYGYRLNTLSVPYRYKETETETKTETRDREKKEEKKRKTDLRQRPSSGAKNLSGSEVSL